MSHALQTADLTWQCIDGIEIPYSQQFADVYFSRDNGLLETQHVFLNGNDLAPRLAALQDFEYFCVGETGFGTGLNILALWQLWQHIRADNHSHLHVISVEKFPLSKADLIRALNAWPELAPFAQQLIQQYPLPLAGCHRLNFPEARFSIDLWLGDAQEIFPIMAKTHSVNAWFLDGFAPACNPDIWQQQVLDHIVRLSSYGTTFSSFSVAGVLKRGLAQHGIQISRPRGFKHKREMLKAIWLTPEQVVQPETEAHTAAAELNESTPSMPQAKSLQQRHIAIVGAGIAGLSCAWALAQRGHQVTLYDRDQPLAGASGNPLALLNPKLCSIEQTDQHLMTLAWQHAQHHYAQFRAFRPIEVRQMALKHAESALALAAQYPDAVLSTTDATAHQLVTNYASLNLLHAGAVSPHQLCEQILQHPLIQFQQAHIQQLTQINAHVQVMHADQTAHFDHVIVTAARDSAALIEHFPLLKPIRGQVSWCDNSAQPLNADIAYSYGGYCMQLNADQLILGASFYPNRADSGVSDEDHLHNLALLDSVFPDYAKQLPNPSTWQGRASIRAQSLDYFPVLGQVHQQQIYTLAGLGSKGFLFAPLCSEVLMAQMFHEACPIPEPLMQKLQLQRFQKKTKPKKPYFKAPLQQQ